MFLMQIWHFNLNLKNIKWLGAHTEQSCHKNYNGISNIVRRQKENNWRNLSSENVVIQKVKQSWGILNKTHFPLLNHHQTQQMFQKFHQG